MCTSWMFLSCSPFAIRMNPLSPHSLLQIPTGHPFSHSSVAYVWIGLFLIYWFFRIFISNNCLAMNLCLKMLLFLLTPGTYFHCVENSRLVVTVFDDMEDDILLRFGSHNYWRAIVSPTVPPSNILSSPPCPCPPQICLLLRFYSLCLAHGSGTKE